MQFGEAGEEGRFEEDGKMEVDEEVDKQEEVGSTKERAAKTVARCRKVRRFAAGHSGCARRKLAPQASIC